MEDLGGIKRDMRTIVYSFVVCDLPHWGHVQHLKKARKLGDVLIVGVLDDDTVESYKRKPVMKLEERMKIVWSFKGVDLVIPQLQKFPLENLKLLHRLFPDDFLLLVHADDWKLEEFKKEIDYLVSIDGNIRLLPYYRKASSTTQLINEVKRRVEKGEV